LYILHNYISLILKIGTIGYYNDGVKNYTIPEPILYLGTADIVVWLFSTKKLKILGEMRCDVLFCFKKKLYFA